MMFLFQRIFLGLCCSCCLLMVAMADDIDQSTMRQLQLNGDIMALEQLIDIAKQYYPDAKVLEVELEKKHDHYFYEIEMLLQNGQVRELKFLAKTGQLLKDEEED